MPNQENNPGGEKPAFCLVHGSFSKKSIFDLLQVELEDRGYSVVPVELPLGEEGRGLSYRDFGRIALAAMLNSGHDRFIPVGHSSGANTILWAARLAPKLAAKIALEKLVYITPSPDEAMLGRPLDKEAGLVPPKYGVVAAIGGHDPYGGRKVVGYNKQMAHLAFFNDCTPERANWGFAQLRPQIRQRAHSHLRKMPNVKAYCLYCTNDWTLTEDWQYYVAQKWLKVKRARLLPLRGSGHFPHVSMPEETAKLLDEIASMPNS